MDRDTPRRRAPDYTNAALAMGLVNLLWMMFAVWAAFGFVWVLLAAGALNLLITRLGRTRRR